MSSKVLKKGQPKQKRGRAIAPLCSPYRVQGSLIFQPALWASCSQDVLAQRSFILTQKFSMFYSAPVN